MAVPENEMRELVVRTAGNLAQAARELKLTRGELANQVRRSAVLLAALTDERDQLIDNAETALRNAVEEGESWAVTFVLKTLGRDRGYAERGESEFDQPLPDEEVEPDLTRLTNDQLRQFEALLAIAEEDAPNPRAPEPS